MKKIRTYVFVFIPTPAQWTAQAPVIRVFNERPNGTSLAHCNDNETLRWARRHRHEGDAQTLPGHLFWTWFVGHP
jgi:hypothetical protein